MRRLSVIVVSYAVRELLRRCLASLDVAGGRGHEVVVVDNHSPDGSADMVRRDFPWVKVVEMGANRGFSAAVNAGARASSGEALFLLNPDTELPEHGLRHAAEALFAEPRVAALGFRLLDGTGHFQLAVGLWPGFSTELLRRFVQRRLDHGARWMEGLVDRLLARPRDIAWVAGASLLVRREAFDSVQGFDERFFLYFEDIDFCLRLWNAGWSVRYDPRLTLVHHRGESARRAPELAARAYRQSQLWFWEKHRGPRARSLVALYQRLAGLDGAAHGEP